MGIQGLLPLLKDVSVATHISAFKGQTLGVDAYVWLHRGAYGCAQKLAMGQHTDSYVDFAMARVRMLQYHGVTPYLVFDGDRLPAKAKTEADRAIRREESRARATTLLQQGLTKQAHDIFAKSVDVTPAMAYQLIKRLRKAGVPYIVAPYEADAQLAYLERRRVIAAIITEDSDLLVFGSRTVLYKLDIDGACIQLKRDQLTRCKNLALHGFDDARFRQMAILSGCDYLGSIVGMGLKTAHRLLRKCDTVAKAIQAARMEGMRVSADYQQRFDAAERTFVFQRVFERDGQGHVSLTTLHPLFGTEGDKIGADPCIGYNIPQEQWQALANGDLDPITRESIVDLSPARSSAKQRAPPRFAGGPTTASRGPFNVSRSANVVSSGRHAPDLSGNQRKVTSFFTKSTAEASAGASVARVHDKRRAESAAPLRASAGASTSPKGDAVQLVAPQSPNIRRSRFFATKDTIAESGSGPASTTSDSDGLPRASASPAQRDESAKDTGQLYGTDNEDSGCWQGEHGYRADASQVSDIDTSSPVRSPDADGLISSPITPGCRSPDRCSTGAETKGARKRLRLDDAAVQSPQGKSDVDELLNSPTHARTTPAVALRFRGAIDRAQPSSLWEMQDEEKARLPQQDRPSLLLARFAFCDGVAARASPRPLSEGLAESTNPADPAEAQLAEGSIRRHLQVARPVRTPKSSKSTAASLTPQVATSSKARLNLQLDPHVANAVRAPSVDSSTPCRTKRPALASVSASNLTSFRFMPGAVSRAHTWASGRAPSNNCASRETLSRGDANVAETAQASWYEDSEQLNDGPVKQSSRPNSKRAASIQLKQREPPPNLSKFRFEGR